MWPGRALVDRISCVALQPSYMLQSEELRASLLARYPPEKLFQAERNFNAAQDLDVSLLEGDLVGVIKKKDPMGSQNRWLIDNGGRKVRPQITLTLNEEEVISGCTRILSRPKKKKKKERVFD